MPIPSSKEDFVELVLFSGDNELTPEMLPDDAGWTRIGEALDRAHPHLEHQFLDGVKENFHTICTELAILSFVLLKNLRGDEAHRSRWVYRAIERLRDGTQLAKKPPPDNDHLNWGESRFAAEVRANLPSATNRFLRDFFLTHFFWVSGQVVTSP